MRNPLLLLALGGLLSACSTSPISPTPDQSAQTADALVRAEPLHRYANRPYKALGKTYTPLTTLGTYKAKGMASWYGKQFHGQRTSIGETYDMYAMSAAHPTLPIPSYARITHVTNGQSIVVRVNDRGPFVSDRIIDLSYAAAQKLGFKQAGSAEVLVESLAPPSSKLSAPTPAVSSATTTMPTSRLSASDVKTTTNTAYLQVGSFKTLAAAETFMSEANSKLTPGGAQLSVSGTEGLQRVYLGPYSDAADARTNIDKVRNQLGVSPFVTTKRTN
jgi:rare lipoprotein A